jgi:hypothetical protein
MTEDEYLKEAERKKRTLFLLIGGTALLILPLIVLAIAKLIGSTSSSSAEMNGSIFYGRTIKIGSKIAPAPTPAASMDPSGLTPPPPSAVPAPSSLGMIVGYKGPAAPKPALSAKPQPRQIVKTPQKTLNQINPQKPRTQYQTISAPQLKPSPFGNSPTQANAPQAPNVKQAPNTQDIINNVMKGMPQGQSIPPNVQQMIQQATQQGGAPPVPPPTQ